MSRFTVIKAGKSHYQNANSVDVPRTERYRSLETLDYIWLRDNDARSTVSIGQNSNNTFKIPLDIKPATVTLNDTLDITWAVDGSVSQIDLVWLKAHSYTQKITAKRQLALKLWNTADFSSGLVYYDYAKMVRNEKIMRDMLQHFRDYGFAVLQKVPTEDGMVLKVLKHFGYPRETHHNHMWDIKLKPTSEDIGYRDSLLPGHVDQPYRQILPTVTLLHFIANNVAQGDSTLVDGFYLAEQLRKKDPVAFQLLSKIPITYRYRDQHTDLHHVGPIIELDSRECIRQVRMNSFSIQPFNIHPDKMMAYYRAYQIFGLMMEDEANRLTVKLESGYLLLLDNLRILHGRLGYTNTKDSKRHVQGCFSDQDSFWSKLAVLNRTLNAG